MLKLLVIARDLITQICIEAAGKLRGQGLCFYI